jgi:hypothetical protein
MHWDDLSEDVAQISRLEQGGRQREARLVRDELRLAFPGHPQLVRRFVHRTAWASGAVTETIHDRATESIVTFRPSIARRPLRPARAPVMA